MKRPYVVCHMMATIDGRILTERWTLSPAAEKQYEAVHALHRADAWLCGRRTFQNDFQDQERDATYGKRARVPSGDFVSPEQLPAKGRGRGPKPVYAIAVDPKGKVHWDSNVMRGDRLVVLTTAAAPSGYLAGLRAKSISYFIVGNAQIDFASALDRLGRIFGIKKLMLEGGGTVNGSLLAEGVIDEISLLVCPFADGSDEAPTVFDARPAELRKHATKLHLRSIHRRPGEVVWLRYDVA